MRCEYGAYSSGGAPLCEEPMEALGSRIDVQMKKKGRFAFGKEENSARNMSCSEVLDMWLRSSGQ